MWKTERSDICGKIEEIKKKQKDKEDTQASESDELSSACSTHHPYPQTEPCEPWRPEADIQYVEPLPLDQPPAD